jgi:uncharacterized protein
MPHAPGRQTKFGTVEKSQGQDAPVSILSLTAAAAMTRLEAGLSAVAHCLNVVISQAQCLSIMVGSPVLATGSAKMAKEARRDTPLTLNYAVNA